jgi:uncharacterized membrane protein HdeD (DUF308 family)
MTLGILLLGDAAYLRSQLEDENLFVVLGVITIILGVMTFFFGESEEKIVQEDEE